MIFKTGDRVIDVPMTKAMGFDYRGTVRRLIDSRRVYVEWDCDPGYKDTMYVTELELITDGT